jgi:hypothetical protein
MHAMPQARQMCGNYAWFPFISNDYAYARARATLPKKHRTVERGYEVAKHFAETIASARKETTDLESLFRENVDKWKRETGHLSSLTRALTHPSYLRIIGLSRVSTGYELERLLLQELASEPDHWFAALSAITGIDPVKETDSFDKSVEAWVSWGRNAGII